MARRRHRRWQDHTQDHQGVRVVVTPPVVSGSGVDSEVAVNQQKPVPANPDPSDPDDLDPDPYTPDPTPSRYSDLLPYRIDVNRTAEGGAGYHDPNYLGGLEWSPEFTRWIGKSRPTSVQAVERLREEWWLHPYLLGRMRAALGDRAVEALLAYLRDDQHYWIVTRQHRKGAGWLERQQRRAHAIVLRLLPDTRPFGVLDDQPDRRFFR